MGERERTLTEPVRTPRPVPHRTQVNRFVAVVVGAVAVGLVPWIVFLALTLPRHYDARHWTLLWTGFDVAVCLVLAELAWSAWKLRQIAVASAIVAGTLLTCDAWFDVVTSWGNPDHWVTVVTAVFGELPLAAFLFWMAFRVMTRVVATFHVMAGDLGPPPALLRAPAMTMAIDPRGTERRGDSWRVRAIEESAEGARLVALDLREALDRLDRLDLVWQPEAGGSDGHRKPVGRGVPAHEGDDRADDETSVSRELAGARLAVMHALGEVQRRALT